MAHVQRAGGVGRDELDHHALAAGGLAAEARPRPAPRDHGLAGAAQAQVDEAGAGDLERRHPALHRRLACSAATSACASRAGSSSALRASCIAAVMARSPWAACLGDSKAAAGAAPGASSRQRRAGLQQLLLGLDHRAILRVGSAGRRPAAGHRLLPDWRAWPGGSAAGSAVAAGTICGHAHAPLSDRQPPPCPPPAPRSPAPDAAELPRMRIGKYPVLAAWAKAPPARSSWPATSSAAATWRSSACARLPPAARLARGALPAPLLRRRGGAGRAAAAPERGADLRRGVRRRAPLPGDGVRAGVTLRRFCRADRCCRWSRSSNRLQVRDGAGLRLPPGPDPPRREAGQPAGGDGRRPGHDVKITDFGSVLQPDADRPRSTAWARWPTCRPSSSTATRWTAAPTSTRWRRCCTT
jgi:hypothetical protein